MDIEQFLQLGIAGVALYLMFKALMRVMDNNDKLSGSIEKNTTAITQLTEFMRAQNGTVQGLVQVSPTVKKAVKQTLQADS